MGTSKTKTPGNGNVNCKSNEKSPQQSKSRSLLNILKPSNECQFRTRDEIIVPLLAQRSFHLPGNSWREDWVQYMRNNHILFGMCFHHPLHPIERWERIVVVLGSLSFAMVATNIGYIVDRFWFGEDYQFDPSEVVYAYTWNTTAATVDNYGYGYDSPSFEITYGTLILWTFGCTFHNLFDILLWRTSACACFNAGGRFAKTAVAARCHDLGSFLLIPLVTGLLGLAGYSSYLRLTNANALLEDEYEDDLVDTVTAGRLQVGEYTFLIRFGGEVLLAWMVFFPLLSTIVFSGILGCKGWNPLLGGRPRDVWMLRKSMRNTILVPNGDDDNIGIGIGIGDGVGVGVGNDNANRNSYAVLMD